MPNISFDRIKWFWNAANNWVLVRVVPANSIEAESRILPAGVSLISGSVGQTHYHVQELHMATKVIIVPNLWTEEKKSVQSVGLKTQVFFSPSFYILLQKAPRQLLLAILDISSIEW